MPAIVRMAPAFIQRNCLHTARAQMHLADLATMWLPGLLVLVGAPPRARAKVYEAGEVFWRTNQVHGFSGEYTAAVMGIQPPALSRQIHRDGVNLACCWLMALADKQWAETFLRHLAKGWDCESLLVSSAPASVSANEIAALRAEVAELRALIVSASADRRSA